MVHNMHGVMVLKWECGPQHAHVVMVLKGECGPQYAWSHGPEGVCGPEGGVWSTTCMYM